jgi:hypothetical protein
MIYFLEFFMIFRKEKKKEKLPVPLQSVWAITSASTVAVGTDCSDGWYLPPLEPVLEGTHFTEPRLLKQFYSSSYNYLVTSSFSTIFISILLECLLYYSIVLQQLTNTY